MKFHTAIVVLVMILGTSCGHFNGQQSQAGAAEFKMGGKMDEVEFWNIVSYANSIGRGNSKLQELIITRILSGYQPDQIIEFELILRRKLIQANDFKILAADRIIDGPLTDDTYLYFRCWLIGLGEKTFTETMKDPDYLADVIEKRVEPDFEGLLYVSTTAYQNRTGKKTEDDSFPQNVAFDKGLDYDANSPKTTGQEWKEKDLPKLYPKLWAKFN